MMWFYVSISDDDHWVGAAFIEAESSEHAVDVCRLRGYLKGATDTAELMVISTGGEIPQKILQNRLLTSREELERYVGRVRCINTPSMGEVEDPSLN